MLWDVPTNLGVVRQRYNWQFIDVCQTKMSLQIKHRIVGEGINQPHLFATSLIYHAFFTPVGFRHFNVDCCAYYYIMQTYNGFQTFCAVCIFLQNSFVSLKKFRSALRKSAALAAPTYKASVIVESCSSSCTVLIASPSDCTLAWQGSK